MTNRIEIPAAKFVGNGQDLRTKQWFRVAEVRDPNGVTSLVPIPFDAPPPEIFRRLGQAGSPYPLHKAEKDRLLDALHPRKLGPILPVVSAPGWVDGKTFSTPIRNYGTKAPLVHNYQGTFPDHRFGVSGNLEDWIKHVAAPCYGNSNLMFAISMFLAGPLMALMRMETAGFMLVGSTSMGKTVEQRVGGSIYGGGGQHGFVRTWNSTPNALDLVAAAHNDCGLALDEVKLAGPSDTDQAKAVIHTAYRLSGGEEKFRLGQDRKQFEWRFPYLGSSEETVDVLARRANLAVPLGQRVRIMELKADAGSGMGVFEQVPSKYASRPDMFADALKDAVADYYGAPADAFLERLVYDVRSNRQNLISSIDRRMVYFLSKLASETRSGPLSRMAKYFALVYVAGRLANHYDVLPWKKRDMFQAMTKCYQRLIVPPEFSNPHTPQRSIVTVRDYIRRLKGTFIDLDTHTGPLTKRDLADAAGIVHKRRGGEPEYLFAPHSFDNHVCGELAPEAVFQHLKDADILYLDKGGKKTVPRDFPNPLGRHRVIAMKSKILKHQ